ncbi:MAG: translation elongation factor Ts [bacterium]
MNIDAKSVMELREKTGAGIMDCKKALAEAGGDTQKAIEILRKKGAMAAARKAGRAAKEGIIGHYVHFGGKIGVLVELNCETDFVANTQEFQELAKDLAMQVASAQPLYVDVADVPEEVLAKEKEIYRAQALGEGKPEKVVDRIVEGKLKKFYSQVCLMEQPFVKEDSISVRQRVEATVGKLGENILVRRFVRFQVGEGS